MDKVLLLSGHYPASHWQSQTNHKVFASKSGFDYRHNSHCTEQTVPYLHKLAWLLDVLDLYDFVFWIDDDSFFGTLQPEEALSLTGNKDGFFLAGRTEEPGVETPPINTCFFGVRSNTRVKKLLQDALDFSEAEITENWDPSDGKSYGGDQDRIWLALKKSMANSNEEMAAEFALIDDISLNGRFQDVFKEDLTRGVPKILHLTGRSEKKWSKLAKMEQLPGWGHGLLRDTDIYRFPALRRGHHRIIASRMADFSKLQVFFRLLPRNIRLRLSGKA